MKLDDYVSWAIEKPLGSPELDVIWDWAIEHGIALHNAAVSPNTFMWESGTVSDQLGAKIENEQARKFIMIGQTNAVDLTTTLHYVQPRHSEIHPRLDCDCQKARTTFFVPSYLRPNVNFLSLFEDISNGYSITPDDILNVLNDEEKL